MKIQVTIDYSEQELMDIICNGYEAGHYGIGYWFCCTNSVRVGPNQLDYASLTGIDAEVVQDDHAASLEEHLEQHEKLWVIDTGTIARGIELVFKKYPDRYSWTGPLIEKDLGMIDAELSDVIIQLGLFGEIVYG